MGKIILELDSYNLEDAIIAIVARVVDENKVATEQEIADILGISSRTLARYRKKYEIVKLRPKTISAIRHLVSLGYNVDKRR